MTIYNRNLVDEVAKTNLLKMLAEYESYLVTTDLGSVFSALLRRRASDQESAMAPDLDGFAGQTYARFTISGFGWLLAEKGEFGPPRQRWPNGNKPLPRLMLATLVLSELEGLSYAIKLNTWVATSEEWLQVCNIDWIEQSTPGLCDPPPPISDNVAITRWMPKALADINYFY